MEAQRVDVQQLRCFVAVADELHFGRAAERLHLTTSPVSRAVKELERELGVELFVRGHHSVGLTGAGRELLEPARSVLEQFERLRTVANRAQPLKQRTLRLGAAALSPPRVVDQVVETLEQLSDLGQLEVVLASTAQLVPVLRNGGIDVAIVHLPLDKADDDLEVLLLASYSVFVAMRADDPLASRNKLAAEDLATRIVTLPASSMAPVMASLTEFLKAKGVAKLEELASTDTAVTASHVRRAHGLTLTLHPSSSGPSKVYDDPAFALVPLQEPELQMSLAAVWRPEVERDDPLVRAAVKLLLREWPREPVIV